MKKILIITYYWIPSGGAGVQRWVKFVKYLHDFGWEPIIYTPKNPEYPSEDFSLIKDIPCGVKVIKKPIWEPYNIYRNLAGKKGQKIQAGFISENKKSSWKDKLSIWIRGNFLIPDPRRFWINPSVRYLKSYLEENKIDAIATTGPPHSMHLIGKELKKLFPTIKWIADFRDPWTNIDFYDELNLTKLADKIHHKLEREVVESADCVITVSPSSIVEFQEMGASNVQLITNGFDEDDVSKIDIELDSKFSIAHIGTLSAARNPEILWNVLSKLCVKNSTFREDLEIKLIGKVDFSILESIQKNNLDFALNKIDYFPHNEAISEQQKSQVLLLLINQSRNAKAILTGKFFEYMAAKRPILTIGPKNSDVEKLLNETKSGEIVDFSDEENLEKIISDYYKLYQNKELSINSTAIGKYSRFELTKQLANILNLLTEEKTT